MKFRKEFELPEVTNNWAWKYHHIGIPTKEIKPNERYIEHLKFYVSGFPESPFGIEWMRFETDSPIHQLVQQVPHIAFEVDNLDLELSKRTFKILTKPNLPSAGVRVAMIEHNGAPVELMEFIDKKKV